MSDYTCEHGGMAMGRDCAQCAVNKKRPLPKSGEFRGRCPKTRSLVWRTVVDQTYGGSVVYCHGRGKRHEHKPQFQCTREEWWTFIEQGDVKRMQLERLRERLNAVGHYAYSIDNVESVSAQRAFAKVDKIKAQIKELEESCR